MNRRKFIRILFGGGIAGFFASILYPVIKYLIPPEELEAEPDILKVGRKTDFPAGSSKIFRFGRAPVILIHSRTGGFLAFAASCTHLDCLVQYRDDMSAIWCACHNGKYDLGGRNISGPPPRPLKQFAVKVIKDEIFIAKT
jgi:Rieske Fe-S protein